MCAVLWWFAQRRTHQPHFEVDIFFSDGDCFLKNGTVIKHNAVYWAIENVYFAVDAHHKTDPRLNVWCGIHGDVLIEPSFLNNKLTIEQYREHLEITLLPYMDDQPLGK